MELEKQRVDGDHKEMDLTQSKMYLSELEAIIRKLEKKNEEDKMNHQSLFEEYQEIQTGLMN